MKKAVSVDNYIAMAPEGVQEKLNEIRAAIRSVAPMAEEKISYGMPYYGYKGRLAYFSYFKKHIGLYIPPPIVEDHKNELKKFGTSVSAIRFPMEQKLPISLIKKLVRARVVKNEERQ